MKFTGTELFELWSGLLLRKDHLRKLLRLMKDYNDGLDLTIQELTRVRHLTKKIHYANKPYNENR